MRCTMDVLSKRPSEFSSKLKEIFQEIEFDEWEVFEYKLVESTNDTAKRLLSKHSNVIVISETQIKGRGTNAREWSSLKGGIWITIGSRNCHKIAEYSSMVAKRITKLLSDVIDEECIHKPENDIILSGKKVAGVLVETKILRDHLTSIIVGVGINVFNKIPDSLSNIAISLSEFFVPYSLEKLATEVALEVVFLLRNYNFTPETLSKSNSM